MCTFPQVFHVYISTELSVMNRLKMLLHPVDDLQVRAFLQPPMEGVVLQTYGQGNGPTARADIMAALKDACDRGVIIVNTTQCSRGVVSPMYAVGKELQDIGVIAGSDMTVEAALMKLSYILGKGEWSLREKREVR